MGVDVGGTFTDLVVLHPDGNWTARKVLSTPPDYSEGILAAFEAIMREQGIAGRDVGEVIHGTTVATNAILTRTGARTGLIATRGFRDVLEFARLRMPRLYDMAWDRPPPLVPRALRVEVEGRIAASGEVLTPLDPASVAEAVRHLRRGGVESVAVCLLHAYANPAHEEWIGRTLAQEAPDLFVSLSSTVLPEIREFERTSTTVVNAYIQPVVKRYVERLAGGLAERGIACPLLLMQSNGGVGSAEAAAARPIHIIESGPAAGVMGTLVSARQGGMENLISFDMGGTTAKACIIEHGRVTRATEYEVGAELNVGHRLLKGGGYLVRVPILDIAEVGAGGGSIAWIAPGGILKVGPQSAGASPGPVCYGRGGQHPTVTDANVTLGYLNPDTLAGGAVPLDAEAARRSLRDGLCGPLGLDLVAAAYGIHRISNATMVRAVRAVSTERGRDPRKFALFAYGGGGPVHAVHLAQELEMARVVVPPSPGLFSSTGLLFSEQQHHAVRTFWRRFPDVAVEDVDRALAHMREDAYGELQREGYPRDRVRLRAAADIRYVGQNTDLTIPLPDTPGTRVDLAALQEAFEHEHEVTYGYRSPGEPVQFANLRLVAQGVREAGAFPMPRQAGHAARGASPGPAAARQRRVCFGPTLGWIEAPVVSRGQLDAAFQTGPLVVEEYDSTTVVPPGCRACRDDWDNIVIEVRRP